MSPAKLLDEGEQSKFKGIYLSICLVSDTDKMSGLQPRML